MSFERIIPKDIKFEYQESKFSDVRNILYDSNSITYPEFLFLLSLVGLNRNLSQSLDAKVGSGEFTISRTIYSRSSTIFDTYYGLVTILANNDLAYDEVLNKMAFCRNTEGGLKYTDLVNVNTFYSHFLGGIEPLYDLVSRYDKTSPLDVFDGICDEIDASHSQTIEVYSLLDAKEQLLGEENESTEM